MITTRQEMQAMKFYSSKISLSVAVLLSILSSVVISLVDGKRIVFSDNSPGHKTITATFSKQYIEEVNDTFDVSFLLGRNTSDGKAVRISVSSETSTTEYPIMFSVMQQSSIMSWQNPLILLKHYVYHNISRTLCPLVKSHSSNHSIIVEVSTMSPNSTAFTFEAFLEDIVIESGMNGTIVSPAKPRYFLYHFPTHIDSVVITAESNDSYCSVFSIQDATCPVLDLLDNVEFVGNRQTVTKRGAITLQRQNFKSGAFFIVLVVKTDDYDCSFIDTLLPPINLNSSKIDKAFLREKTFNISIQSSISNAQFWGATFGAFGFFMLFYVFALVVALCHCWTINRTADAMEIVVQEGGASENSGLLSESTEGLRNYSSYGHTEPAAAASNRVLTQRQTGGGAGSGSAGAASPAVSPSAAEDEEIDFVPDASYDKEITRTKLSVCVADLSRKSEKVLTKKYNLYVWNLITLTIFYVLPVIQLVITYQAVVNKTGDEDICYYNFYCARAVGFLSSFNNVFSNIGYILLGFLFIILVFRRDRLHRNRTQHQQQLLECSCDLRSPATPVQQYGIPQHFGVFYAMGIALVMEGVLSGCYHVCPSYNNFQFDTAFMYMIGWLCMLKIYQTRHPDINAHAHTAYCMIAVIVFIGVLGVATKGFWIAFLLLYIICSLVLTIHVYYMGRWKLDLGAFKRVYARIQAGRLNFLKPLYISRFILLILANGVNFSFAAYGFIIMPKDFASYLLAIVIINLLMYFVFYVVMKLVHGERLLAQPIIYIICGGVVWAFALYFFMARLTSWQVSPAMSRENNEHCLLLDFYDSHDIWHFLSALSLFLGFMLLLTLEDDLVDVPRDKISVF